jgi:outer membrane protein OmpU
VVELEGGASAGGANAIIDESYLRIVSPTLGELRLGADDAVDAIMVVQANRGISGDYDNWIVEAGLTKNDNLYDNASSDTNKVSYFTPKIAGFQAGVSFANTTTASEVDPPNYRGAVGGPVWAGAVTYETKMGDVGVKLGASMSRLSASNVSAGRDNMTGGAQLSFQGFSLSGGYAKTDQNIGPLSSASSLDGDRYQIGLQYATGPYTVGVWHMNDQNEGVANIAKDDETKVYTAYGQYVLSDGVRLEGMVFKVDYNHEVEAAGNQLGGWGVVTGFRLDF